MKHILKLLFALMSLALALTMCPAVSAAAEPEQDMEWCEVMEDGTVIYYPGDPAAELMAEEEQDPDLPQLSAPTDLEWGKYYPHASRINADGTQDTTCQEVPGMASWTLGADSQNQYLITYYREDPSGDKRVAGTRVTLSEDHIFEGCIGTNEDFLQDVRETGDYYFTVRALGDGKTCRDSETVRSETWHFEDPGVRLSAPGGAPVWADAPNAAGDPVVSFVRSDDPQVLVHRLRYYYTSGPKAKTEYPGTALLYNNASSYKLSANMRRFGAGYYGASLRYLSRDMTKIQCSEESPASSPLYVSKFYGRTLDEIMGLVSSDSPKKDIQDAVDAVRKMNAGKLAASMWADQDNSGAAGQIKTLEELAGIVKVDVSDALSGVLDEAKVDVIGAGLNAKPGESVTLKIDQPSGEGIVVPALYGKTVQISMDLVDDAGKSLTPPGEALAFPIKLTIPISETGIRPGSLILMHRNADGTCSELFANSGIQITTEGDESYGTFMVRSPGSYVLAERPRIDVRPTPSNGGGLQVKVNVNPGERDLTAALAVFDSDGRQIGLSLVDLTGKDQISQLVPCDYSAASLVRVMILEDYKPAERAWSVSIKMTPPT